jgi:ABC-type polysaccharide/polyol phosphate export permease
MIKPAPITVYDSSKRGIPAREELHELLRYRNLVFQTIRRNIIVRYKRSFLGVAWTMLNPLGTTLVMTIVFSQVFGGGANYAAYVLCGLISWTFFSQTTSDAMGNLLWGGDLLRRIYIPRTLFAVSAVGTGLVNLLLSLVPLILVLLVTDVPLTWNILLLPIPALFLALFSLGAGLLLSTIAIYFADVAEMYRILLTAWMYLSPVIYREEMIPQQYLWIVRLNPMYYLINAFRAPVYDGIVNWTDWLYAGSIGLVTFLVGWLIFTQKADEFTYRV